MTEPAAFDAETTPTISLGGKEWPVPELVWRDLRRCRKELLELTGLLNVASSEAPPDPDGDAAARSLAILSQVFQSLSNDDFDRLVIGVIFVGLGAMHPNLKREEVDGWVIGESDAELAWLTVRRQSGLFTFRGAPAADEDAPPGEADGAA